ncbi:GTP-binding protein [Litorivicinus sp.]|nr:GTP-binding protein [Litorivicinus sp.]
MTRPVCIVTGFLGAGKTTLALGLIRSGELKDAVLIVNDFGDASFDSVEVGATGTAYRAMDGGCICCTIKDDLLRILHEIPSLFPNKKMVWIETSGISNPSDLIPLFEGSSFLSETYSLQSVVAVVDGRNSFDWLLAQESAAEQLSMASVSIINRHDKVQGLDYLKQQLHSLNPLSDVHIVSLKDEPPITTKVFFNPANAYTIGQSPIPIGDKHRHESHGYTTQTIRWEGTVDEFEFVNLFSIWIEQIGPGVLRLKGTVRTNGNDQVMIIQGVRRHVTFDYKHSGWPTENVLVVIGRSIERDVVDSLLNGILSLKYRQLEEETCQK